MKITHLIIAASLLAPLTRAADEPTPKERLAMHREGSDKIADEQDELSADVQQLVIEQTAPKVIELLNGVENIMDEATERLAEADTGGETIAAQTEIIELIHAAAKEKQSQGGGGKSGGAMMDMMERMMGKKPGAGPNGKGNSEKASDTGSNGQTGESDTGNEATNGQDSGNSETRRVPKAAGATSAALPEEFRKAFDAYNRGAEEKVK